MRAKGLSVVFLDGDELREVFGSVAASRSNYGRDARLALAIQYAHLCRVIAAQGVSVVIATISLFQEVHAWNRMNLPGYFEAYLKVPMDELRQRDAKGIYRRYDAGELRHVAGLDLSIDEPLAADWIAEYEPGRTVTMLVEELMTVLENRENNAS